MANRPRFDADLEGFIADFNPPRPPGNLKVAIPDKTPKPRPVNEGWAARLRIDPSDNVITGMANIMAYVDVRTYARMINWIENYGFPAVKRPDGVWLTTITAIDQWIFLASEVTGEKRTPRRFRNGRLEAAMAVANKTDMPARMLATVDEVNPEFPND